MEDIFFEGQKVVRPLSSFRSRHLTLLGLQAPARPTTFPVVIPSTPRRNISSAAFRPTSAASKSMVSTPIPCIQTQCPEATSMIPVCIGYTEIVVEKLVCFEQRIRQICQEVNSRPNPNQIGLGGIPRIELAPHVHRLAEATA